MRQTTVSPALTTLRRHLTVIALAMAVVVGSIAVQPAGAERVPTNGDSHQIGCRALQDRLLALVDEYKKDSTGATRGAEILAEITQIGFAWKQLHCDSRYGTISIMAEVPIEIWAALQPVQGDLSPDANVPPAGPPTGVGPIISSPVANSDASQDTPKDKGKPHRGKGGKHGKGKKGKRNR